jgi:iron complex outermembrane receptor protein
MAHKNTGRKRTRSAKWCALRAGGSLTALTVALGPIALWAGSAQAGDSPATTDAGQQSSGLEEIVVSARRREESMQTTPISVSAATGATLETAQVARIDDIAQFAPNVEISEQGPGTPILSMRGISSVDPILTADSPVAMYVDGVYLGRTAGALLDLIDIDHIEVLRGPQGTLFGRNTPAGAISVFTQAPAEKFGLQQKLGYASNNEITSTTTLDTGELAGSGLSAKVTYRHHQMDGYIRNTLSSWANSQGADNADDVFTTVRYTPVEEFAADYKFDFHDEAVIPIRYQVGEVAPATASYFGASRGFGGAPFGPVSESRQGSYADFSFTRAKVRVNGHSLTLNYTFSDALKIKSISAYRSLYSNSATDMGNSGQMKGPASTCPAFVAALLGCIPVPITVQNVYLYYSPVDHQHQHQVSEELQFGGGFKDLNYIVGLYYFDEHVGEVQPSNVTVPLGPVGLIADSLLDYTGTSSSKAGFAQVSYSPTELFANKLELTVGARYTRDEKTIDQNDSIADRNLSHTFSNVGKSASVKYRWTSDIMTYARYAEGYKAGGYSARALVNGTSLLSAYLPEQAKSYEVGMKVELLDHRVRLNADIFRTDYSDLQLDQLTLVNGTLATEILNAGKALYRGAEAEITVLPYAGWLLNGTLGYVNPTYREFLIGAPPNQIDAASIARFAATATTTASASAQYSFATRAAGDLTLRTDWSYTGPRYYSDGDFTTNAQGQGVQLTYPGLTYGSDATKAPGFSNLGAQVILNNIPLGLGAQWMVTFYGKNLLNQYQKVFGLDLGSAGFIDNAWGRGRVLGINVGAKF